MTAPPLALLVNPIAGMGGAVALKGTDGVLAEALARGARPVAHARAVRFLGGLPRDVRVFTCSGPMGADACREAGRACEAIVTVHEPTSADDTRRAARAFAEAGVGLLVFVGGDGTAFDVAAAIGHRVASLGVPSGVKMNSAVFAETPEAAAEAAASFLRGDVPAEPRDVLEVDEGALRRGEVRPARLASLLTPAHDSVIGGKAETGGTLESIIEFVQELARPGATLVLGPGSTLFEIKRALVDGGTLLGVDAISVDGAAQPRLLFEDATAADLTRIPASAWIVVSPLGGQGFVLGRGNQQLVPDLLRRLGWERLVVVATPEKLRTFDALRLDTGDPALDAGAPAHMRVVTGPGFTRLVRVRAARL